MKRKTLEKISLAVLMLGLWGIMYSAYLVINKSEIEKAQRLHQLLAGTEPGVQLRESVKFDGCLEQNSLPDADCTPGAVFLDATREKICISGYSKTARNVSMATKRKVFARYGIPYPQPFGSYEVDHLIPLALGGSNDIANLWPKSATYPGFYEKNVTGNYLYEEVCAGRIVLGAAQEAIARNWLQLYENLNEETIRRFKSKYKNWAD